MQLYSTRKLWRQSTENFMSANNGLMLSKSDQYITASSDLTVECKFHGKGLCEIKSPYKTRHLSPAASHLAYLKTVNCNPQLKRNSDYYFQVQAQMGVTGLKYCDFLYILCMAFIWSGLIMTQSYGKLYAVTALTLGVILLFLLLNSLSQGLQLPSLHRRCLLLLILLPALHMRCLLLLISQCLLIPRGQRQCLLKRI